MPEAHEALDCSDRLLALSAKLDSSLTAATEVLALTLCEAPTLRASDFADFALRVQQSNDRR